MPSPLARLVLGPDGAPTLVLLHGLMSSALSQAATLTRWAGAGYRVVAVDARGHGLSPRWDTTTLARAGEQLVDDAVAVLEGLAQEAHARDAAGLPVDRHPDGRLRAPVLIGHSMGAATAMAVAGRRPGLLSGAVLEDPALAGTRTATELAARGAARERARDGEAADQPAATARALASRDPAEALPSVWATTRCDPALLRAGTVAPPQPWEEALAAVAVPTLLLTGDRPGSARLGPGRLERARALSPHVHAVLVPGAGHQVRVDDPEAYHDAVETWLARVLPVGVRGCGHE